MGARAQKTHEVTIKIKFDIPVWRKDAVQAAWFNLQDTTIYGIGDVPWERAHITVQK